MNIQEREPRITKLRITALGAALEGGAIALQHFRRGIPVIVKSDGTPVTPADREVELAIKKTLARDIPGCGFVGEETEEEGPSDRLWRCDPIDGTKNFIAGLPDWAVLLSYEEDGEVVVAVVNAPARKEVWVAVRGGGACCNSVLQCHVSKTPSLKDALLLHGSVKGLMRDTALWTRFTRLADAAGRTRGPGDFTGFMMVAQGYGDIYVERGLKLHDVAAPSLIVTEAGGQFTFFPDGGIAIATNGLLHEEVLGYLMKW